MIVPGQIYEGCSKHATRQILIKVVAVSGDTVEIVTISEDGKRLRPRTTTADRLHPTAVTRRNKPRTRDYALVSEPEPSLPTWLPDVSDTRLGKLLSEETEAAAERLIASVDRPFAAIAGSSGS
jgi:hypothetical protein